jgi:hypothetical protein
MLPAVGIEDIVQTLVNVEVCGLMPAALFSIVLIASTALDGSLAVYSVKR